MRAPLSWIREFTPVDAPVDEIVASLDIEAIVARVDLVGVIRESTASVTSEATDALREQGMALDVFTARIVDRLLLRKHPRRLDVGSPA